MAKVIITGSVNQDMIFKTRQFPSPGETRLGEFSSCLGGKGFNQAVAAHRMGAETHFIGAVGKDIYAQNVRDFALQEQLQITLQEHAGSHTGAASVVVDSVGENLIVVASGANALLAPAFIAEQGALITECEIMLCQLEAAQAATLAAFGAAKKAIKILNPAPITSDCAAKIFENADIITPNETEFAHYLKLLKGEELVPGFSFEPEEILHQWCLMLEVPTVVITLGAMGCFVSHNKSIKGRACRLQDDAEFYRLLAPATESVDTSGAGDTFSGALAAGLATAKKQTFASVVEAALRAASLSTESAGTTDAIPTAKAVAERFA